jgi:1-pyrroline-5-carboxylate dehydrogenase
LTRGSFEYQGQKSSAASRAYVPKSLCAGVKEIMVKDLASMKVGTVEDFSNFINAVISETSFDKIATYLDRANADDSVEVVAGGTYDKSEGFFIAPTVLRVDDPKYATMCEELFGPVLSIYVYEDDQFEETMDILDESSPYALTGALFAVDRQVIEKAAHRLRHTAGNFYINDKPTGAVVGQQPFGGGRASGTNDKAGSILNLLRWVSPRTIKETFVPATDYRYPFLDEA